VSILGGQELVGQLVDGRYRIVSRIAHGGMATVYEADDTRLERRVALKVMHPHLADNPDFVERFVREARSAARLSHPNVVAVFDQGADGSDVFLVMELVPGSTLRDLLRARGRLEPREALDIIEPVLDALSAAHAAGLVHRDVKPENVLITPDGRVKVADFGLARATSTMTNATQGVLIGTVAYLSPELVEHGLADARSDVYSAGIVLFEMLTGRPPFDGEVPVSVAYRHVQEDVPAPTSFVPECPPALDALVAGATARAADRRYSDASVFLAAAGEVRRRLGLPAAGPAPLLPLRGAEHDTLVVATALDPAPGHHATGVLADTFDAADPAPGAAKAARPRRSRRRLLALPVFALLLAAVGFVAFQVGAPDQVPVPAVLGQTEPAATAAITEAGLAASIGPAAFSETVPNGRVVATNPAPGSPVDEGGSVTVTLSKGPERYAVPTVAGSTRGDAEKALTNAKLDVGEVTEAYSGTVAKGLVISSDPAAKDKLKRGTPVDLVVSKGPKPIAVPKVVGLTEAQARSRLSAVGLSTASTQQYSEKVAKGTVISQSPSSGTLPPRGTVSLVVSKGPTPIAVPNVVNKSLAEARTILTKAGFRVAVRTDVPGGPGIVLQQSPGGGASRPRGTTVSLDIF
jgi:serine/threonine-protein kinase